MFLSEKLFFDPAPTSAFPTNDTVEFFLFGLLPQIDFIGMIIMGPAQIKRELQKNGKLNCKMRSKDSTTSECICTESDIAKLSTITKHQQQDKKKKT